MVTAYPPAVQPVSSPVEVRFGSTQRQRRVTVLFRLILVLPQVIVLYFLLLAAYVITIIGWFAALFTGRLPESFATFLQGVLRWDVRVVSYAFLLDDRYPPFSLDSDPDYPVDLTVSTGKLNRAAVLFRLILVIPASIVAAVFGWGLGGIAVVVWAITLIIGRLPDPIFGATSAYLRYRSRLTAYFCMLTSWYPSAVLGDGTTESGSGTPGAGGPVSGSWGTPPPPPVPAGPFPGTVPSTPPGTSEVSALVAANPPAYPPTAPPPPAYPPPALPMDMPPMAMPPPIRPLPPPGATPGGVIRSSGRWPLLLTKAARTWSIILIVVGAVGLVAYSVFFSVVINSSSLVARIQVDTAYNTAGQAAQSFGNDIKTCTTNAQSSGGNPLTCYQQTAGTAAIALQLYATQISGISYPTSAQAQASAAEQAAQSAASAFRQLAASTDVQSFATTLQSQSFLSTLNAVDSTYRQLHAALTG